MNIKIIRKGIILATLIGTIAAPAVQALAYEPTPVFTIPVKEEKVYLDTKKVSTSFINSVSSIEEIKIENILEGIGFVEVDEEGYALVLQENNENAEVVGKLYENSAVKILDKKEEWTQVESGNISGFVKTELLISNSKTIEKAKELLKDQCLGEKIRPINKEEIVKKLPIGETVEEESVRLAEEEAVRIEAERIARQQAAVARGESVVAFAKQFLGNPYVYGGTSLTNGTDCSGFVKSVYAHFGISLPRTSSSMRGVGYAVSFNDIMPGDIVCYSGHVGIYAGNGQIVNAIDESHGIGMTRVNYAPIITIRRLP